MRNTNRLRWIQFGLRRLLLLITAVAITSPWWKPPAEELLFPNNQTLPQGFIGTCDDIQYFAPSEEFVKARREAAAAAYETEQRANEANSPQDHMK